MACTGADCAAQPRFCWNEQFETFAEGKEVTTEIEIRVPTQMGTSSVSVKVRVVFQNTLRLLQGIYL